MKNTIRIILALLVLSFCFSTVAEAQRKKVLFLPKYDEEPYHFGFLLAINSMSYTIALRENYQNIDITKGSDNWEQYLDQAYLNGVNSSNIEELYIYNIETRHVPGFTVGIIGNKRLGPRFDLRLIPTLSLGERKMDYSFYVKRMGNNTISPLDNNKPLTQSIFSTFVEFSLQLKYRSKRLNNVAAYIIGGVNPKLDLTSRKRAQSNKFFIPKRFDLALELGTGFDFYNQWFKMGVEVKMSYGVFNIIKEPADIYTSSIDKLSNKMFQLSFTFE